MANQLKKILIIDDDPDIVEAMKMVLESKSYQVFFASNGEEGLRKVKEVNPDLIILDVMMTVFTEGFHVSYVLRSRDPKSEYAPWSKVPILMVTAIHQKTPFRYSPKTDEDFLPVDDWINKPVEPSVLLKKVEELLEAKGGK